MNDNETKVMTFSSVCDAQVPLTAGMGSMVLYPYALLNGAINADSTVTPSAGRAFFAGMMFDRLRFRSVSCSIRPRVMPSTSATNYLVYSSWDRYGSIYANATENTYTIRSDPSAKQVVWTPGGSGSPLRTWIYSTARDRYQYFPIKHAANLTSWTLTHPTTDTSPNFYPTLLVGVEAVTTESTIVQFTVHVRLTVEFQGGFSNTTLNYTPSAAAAAASEAPTVPLEQRIAALESKYNSNPADNNDDFVSVLRDLSNPQ